MHLYNYVSVPFLSLQMTYQPFKKIDLTFKFLCFQASCVDRCVGKQVSVNHKVMSVYAELQPVYLQKRLDEMNKQAEAQMQAQIQEEQQQQLQQDSQQ